MNLFVTYDEMQNARWGWKKENGRIPWVHQRSQRRKKRRKKKDSTYGVVLSILHLHDNGSKRCAIIVRGSTSGYPII